MGIINEDFMLHNKTGKKLFYDFAKDMPIIDYHCHLVPKMMVMIINLKMLMNFSSAAIITNGAR